MNQHRETSRVKIGCLGYVRKFRPLASLVCFLLVTGVQSQSFGQDETPGEEKEVENVIQDTLLQADQSVFISAPREFLRPLIRANRAIAENETARAVSLLGEVLSDSTNEDYLVPVMATEGLSISLRLRAEMTLGSLPAKDRELYRLRYGVQAKQMLEKAVESSDFEAVSQVMQRFFFTPAGFDAAMLLGHHHLDQGRPIAAANCFQRIVSSEEARLRYDPEASVLLATCLMLGAAPDKATEALVRLRKNSRRDSILFLGKPVRLFDKPDDAQKWLFELIGDSPLLQNDLVNQWVMVGGNPQRNARTGMGVPLLSPTWSTPTLNNPDMEKKVIEYQRELIFMGSSPIPAVQPLAIGDTVVMRAFDRMIGVDFQTGKRVWVFPPWDFATDFTKPTEPLPTRNVEQAPLTERLWLDSVYGQASSDGQSIFVVPNPGFSREASNSSSPQSEPAVVRIYNELMALDIRREGAFRWEVGGESGLDEPKLAKAFFLGPPLPLSDELFAVCQQENAIKLVVLNAETGRLKWTQTLGTTENSSIGLSEDRLRRLAGVSPSFANGILVCATGTGALTGVDLSTRSLLWGFQYTTPGRKAVQRISPDATSSTDPLSGVWRDSTILISDGKVLFTPVESQALICVDLQNGFPAWKSGDTPSAKFPRNDSLFLACVENGRAILVGETSLRSVDVQTGEKVWEWNLGEHGKPSGRGYTNNGCYFFPTTTEQLLQIDLSQGKLVKSVRTKGVLGNLVCYRGEVISHGVERLSSFPQDEPKRRLLAEAESKGELSAELLAIKSQLQIQAGNMSQAVRSIEEAYEKSLNRAYENLLLDLIVRAVESDFSSGIVLAEKYERQLMANRRFEYLAARVAGMRQQGQPEKAFFALMDLINPVEQVGQLRNESIPIDVSKYDVESETGVYSENSKTPSSNGSPPSRGRINIRLDQWVSSQISELHENGSDELKARIQSEISNMVSQIEAISLEPVEMVRALSAVTIELIPPASGIDLARRLESVGERLRAIKLLKSLSQSSDNAIAGQSVAMSANIFVRQKSLASAMPLIDRLGADFANAKVSDSQTGAELSKTLRQQMTNIESQLPKLEWNRGDVTPSATTFERELVNLVPCGVRLHSHDEPEYEQYRFRFYGQTGEIEILDALGNSAYRFFARKKVETLQTNYNSYVFGRISIHDHVAFLDIATEMFAFDWLKLKNGEDPMLWNSAVKSGLQEQGIATVARQWNEIKTTTTARNYEQRVYVGAPGLNGICYLDESRLICLDSFTGEQKWRRSSILPHSRLFGDDRHAVVWNAKKRRADVIDIKSGRLVRTAKLDPGIGAIWSQRGCRFVVSNLRSMLDKSEPATDQNAPDAEKRKPKITTEKTLGLYDVLEDKFVWHSVRAAKTMGCLVGQDRIALLDTDGTLEVLDLQTGETQFEVDTKIKQFQKRAISGIGVVVKGDRLLFHLKNGDTYNRVDLAGLNVEVKYINYNDTMWMGVLVCVDAKTGKTSWRSPVRFDNFQLAQNQPYELPFYLLTRRVEKEDEHSNQMDYINIAGIDWETGELVFNDLHDYGYPNSIEIHANPVEQQVQIKFATTDIVYQFNQSNDQPPRPVAHLTNQNSVPDLRSSVVSFNFDKEKIEAARAKSLTRAKSAQALLPQKRAEEKRLLKKERQDK